MRINSILVVALGALAATACSKIDNKDAEKKIKDWATQNIGPATKVSCPAVEMKAGKSFECAVTFEGGGVFKLNVEQKDDKGNVEWTWVVQPIGGVKAAELIKNSLVEQVPDVAADCGTDVRELPAEGITCKVTGDGESVDFVVKLEGANLTWAPKE